MENVIISNSKKFEKLKNKKDIKPIPPIKEIAWLDIEEIKQKKYNVAPNIKYLIEKGDI